MLISKHNPLLATDVYKMGHMEQYAPGCTKVYSHISARSGEVFGESLFFGLQYYLKEYFSVPLTKEMGEEFLRYRNLILGNTSPNVEKKIRALCDLGYFPIEIKSVPEGTLMNTGNVLVTVTNTHPDFYWVVGLMESLLLKIWYPTTVASCCWAYRKVVETYYEQTVEERSYFLKDFAVHDFGYRGDKCEESAALSGAAHLTLFLGSDTVVALPFIEQYYDADLSQPKMLAVPASEHSVMSSFGRENEFEAFENMLRVYPKGIVSIVSDTYDIYKVVSEFAQRLKPQILAREGKIVFRPDSGHPEYVICGNPDAPEGSNERKGVLRILEEVFGSTVNAKGYKELHPKVGLIYGDAMHLQRYQRVLEMMKEQGFAASNLVIGVGRFLRDFSRDAMGFAFKATYIEIEGVPRSIEKSPITDQRKHSFKGLLSLEKIKERHYRTHTECTPEQEKQGLLRPVWKDGKLLQTTSIEEIQKRISDQLA